MSDPPVVEACGLHAYYDTSHILHGIDLTVGRGETVSLMGRNGMGKTTTLRTLLGMVRPRRGSVNIHGRDMTGAAPHRVAQEGIALVPEGRGIFPNLTVLENLVMAARPGRIIESLPIDLPRPRARAVVTSPPFVRIKRHCLALLGSEAVAEAA